MHKVLIVGKIPPPIGGVTIHVKRLTESLRKRGFNFTFCDPGKDPTITVLTEIFIHRIIHIHFSRPWLQLVFAFFCCLTRKKLIITYHGQWGRYNVFGNYLVMLSSVLASVPILQDRASLYAARLRNRHSRQISTFISSPEMDPLSPLLANEIADRQANYKYTFCTNAWNVTFDKAGNEIYGISEMVRRFSDYPEHLLLVSDPSGSYRKFIGRHFSQIPDNVLFVDQPHEFRQILKLSDAFIRNTTTDGVSLSVHEARELSVPVIASNAVDRPAFCAVFETFSKIDLEESLAQARELRTTPARHEDPVGALTDIYRLLKVMCCK
nr:hypothetical protein [uncultured Dyadobacter sp.]